MKSKLVSLAAMIVFVIAFMPSQSLALKIEELKGECRDKKVDVKGDKVDNIPLGEKITIKVKTNKKFEKAKIKFDDNSFSDTKKNDDKSVKWEVGPFRSVGEKKFTVKVYKDKNDDKADDTAHGRFFVGGQTAKSPSPSSGASSGNSNVSSIRVADGPHGGNCVLFARTMVPSLPGPLNNFEEKRRIAKSNKPRKGSVAIIQVGGALANIGHVAVVTKVDDDGNKLSITLREANYPRPGVWERKVTCEKDIHKCEKQVNIVGYYEPR